MNSNEYDVRVVLIIALTVCFIATMFFKTIERKSQAEETLTSLGYVYLDHRFVADPRWVKKGEKAE